MIRCHKHNAGRRDDVCFCDKCAEESMNAIVAEAFRQKGICPKCKLALNKCACEHLTARAPDTRNAKNLGYSPMGEGCYVKKPQFND